jgi:hypothetical protein
MNGLVIITEFDRDVWATCGKYFGFFRLVNSELGWDIDYSNNYDLDKITQDVVMVFKSPAPTNSTYNSNLVKLSSDKKLIVYIADIFCWKDFGIAISDAENTKAMDAYRAMFDRADLILCPYKSFFEYKWGEYKDKFIWFPHFVDYDLVVDVPVNHNPNFKFSLFGLIAEPNYCYRSRIKNHQSPLIVSNFCHPGYSKAPIGDVWGRNYFVEITKYIGGIATPSKLKLSLSKYFEIPAVGSLMLGIDIPDLHDLGFIDGVNYINVDENNIFTHMEYIINNPESYYDLRIAGRDFVLANHTNRNRFESFKNILKGL